MCWMDQARDIDGWRYSFGWGKGGSAGRDSSLGGCAQPQEAAASGKI